MGEEIHYKVLVRKHEGKEPRCKKEDNIKMYLREIEHVVWTGFIWLTIETNGKLGLLVDMITNLHVL
jgi:hypothetical protein